MMDSQLLAELEEDRLRLVLELLETECAEDQPLLALIEFLLSLEGKREKGSAAFPVLEE